MMKPERMTSDPDGKRAVLYRDVRGNIPMHIPLTYDFDVRWMDKTVEDLESLVD
jgi:hypothetical protein